MKVIKEGETVPSDDGTSAGLDIPLDEIAQAFGVSKSFFMNAFESGQVEAQAEEADDGTVVLTFRMGDRELQIGIAQADDNAHEPGT